MAPLYIGTKTITSSDTFGSTGAFKNKYELPIGGLKLYLSGDSYRAGPYWTDIAQNIVFEARTTSGPYNTSPTSRASIGGVNCIDFNDGSYWESTQAGADLVDMRYDFTLVMIYYYEGFAARRTIFEKAGNSYASYQQELACTMETDATMTWYRGYSNYDYSTTKTYSTGGWRMVAINSTGVTDRTGQYYDGSGWVTNYTNRTTSAITAAGPIRVGYGYSGVVQAGYMHACCVWDRKLTTQEINNTYRYFQTNYVTGLTS